MGTLRTRALSRAVLLAALVIPLAGAPAPTFAQSAAEGAGEVPWEKLREDDGIIVHRREVPGSPLVAFKGEGVVNAPILKVGSVLVDVSRSTEWIDSVAESRELRVVGPAEAVTYAHISTPFVVKDREFVTLAHLDVDTANRQLRISIRSVDDALAPKTGYVRGEIMNSSFVLTSIEGGAKTRLVTEIHADPKGSMPKWLVNLFQKSWAHNTIMRLRAQVAKPDIRVDTRLRGLMEAKGWQL